MTLLSSFLRLLPVGSGALLVIFLPKETEGVMMRRSSSKDANKENRLLATLRHPSAFFKKASIYTTPDPIRDAHHGGETFSRVLNAHQMGNTGSIGLPR